MDPAQFKSDSERLRSLGWSCSWRSQPTELPPEIKARYPWLPADYLAFVQSLDECFSADEQTWMLAPADFDIRLHQAWRHDEWEQLSLEAADEDAQMIAHIRRFWDDHIPICLSLVGGYSYYALRVGDKSGIVVSGHEPEFEDCSEVASSFTQFLQQIR